MEMNQILDEMRRTKNKNLYYECSLELYCNFDFITEVINIFCDDFDFVSIFSRLYLKLYNHNLIRGTSQISYNYNYDVFQ